MSELREKSIPDLHALYKKGLQERFDLRMQKARPKAVKSSEHKRVRKEIARILTVLRERQQRKEHQGE